MTTRIARQTWDQIDIVFDKEKRYEVHCTNLICTNLVVFPGTTVELHCCTIKAKNDIRNLGTLHTRATGIVSAPIEQGYSGPINVLFSQGLSYHQTLEVLRRAGINPTKPFHESIAIPGTETTLNDKDVAEICPSYCDEKLCEDLASQGLRCDPVAFHRQAEEVFDD